MIENAHFLFRKFQSFYYYNRQAVRLIYLPLEISVEPTNMCNLCCVMCPQSVAGDIKKGFMDITLFEKIINEIKGYVFTLWLNVDGEPLLHPKLFQMIQIAKANGLNVGFSTNATLLSEEKILKIIDSSLDFIVFSFEGENKEIYEKLRINAKYEVTLNNIINFLKIKAIKKTEKPRVQLQILKFYGNDNSLEVSEKFKQLFRGLPLEEFRVIWAHKWSQDFYKKVSVSYGVPKYKNYFPCTHLWQRMAVKWNGNVVACCLDLFEQCIIGNVKNEELKTIWNNKKTVDLRKLLVKREYTDIPLCRNCSMVWEDSESVRKSRFGLLKVLVSQFLRSLRKKEI